MSIETFGERALVETLGSVLPTSIRGITIPNDHNDGHTFAITSNGDTLMSFVTITDDDGIIIKQFALDAEGGRIEDFDTPTEAVTKMVETLDLAPSPYESLVPTEELYGNISPTLHAPNLMCPCRRRRESD